MPAALTWPCSSWTGGHSRGRTCRGGLGSVDVDNLAVEAVLVEVASGCLNPARGRHAARLPRLEAGRSDQPLDRRRGGIVVCGIEQHGQWVAVGARGEGVRAKRAEGLDVVRA